MFVYVLWHEDVVGQQVVFYVGKTNDPDRREQEHRRDWKTGTEDKYVYIRLLGDTEWYFDVVKEFDKGVDTGRFENHYLTLFDKRPHRLMNMRGGDGMLLWEAEYADPIKDNIPPPLPRKNTDKKKLSRMNKRFKDKISCNKKLLMERL
jgi:hypothetical protein